MNRNLVLAATTCVALLATATPAGAGIINELRQPSASVRTLEMALFATDGRFKPITAATGTGTPGGADDGSATEEVDPSQKGNPVGAYELAQIQGGLITSDEAMAGCGGASAAPGPAGLLPLLVAAGALLRRRRRA